MFGFGLSLARVLDAISPPVVGTWLLLTGVWSDAGVWDDAATWNDGA
jgi:hypothetical protein